LALREQIALACAEGAQNKQVAAPLDVDTVSKRRRFAEYQIDGWQDEPRAGALHWSSRSMARASGLSWLDQVERFFALLTNKQIKRDVADLRSAINAFIDQHNREPKPFRWTKPADDILTSIERFCTYNRPAEAS